jgi:pSer/pThr/pTyr-binding forkhead associated (FHA) protein
MADDVQSQYAVLLGTPDGQVSIRRAESDAEILINGVRLGPQPTPLLHGDKVEIAGQELLFVDDRRSGSTQFIQAVDPAAMQSMLKTPAGQVATASTGGRMVSLTDGREYSITGGSLLIGREAGCDVVVASKNVSRRHAEIVATPKGYILIDSSTNGTFVNGERIQGQKLLARADVVRCGDESHPGAGCTTGQTTGTAAAAADASARRAHNAATGRRAPSCRHNARHSRSTAPRQGQAA